jgi:UPF0716 protein FxsA
MFLILFIVWVVAEIFVIVKVAEAIGVLLTIVLLIAAWPLGGWAMRSEGRMVWRRFNAAVAEGRPPGREVVDGVLVVLGGALLMVPGFISDGFGLLLLFPPTRSLLRAGLLRNLQHRIVARAGRFVGGRPGGRAGRADGSAWPDGAGADVDGTATEVDPPHLRP